MNKIQKIWFIETGLNALEQGFFDKTIRRIVKENRKIRKMKGGKKNGK